jgi:hypothetical protein
MMASLLLEVSRLHFHANIFTGNIENSDRHEFSSKVDITNLRILDKGTWNLPNCIFLKNLKRCVPDGMLITLDPEGDEGNHDADEGASPWIDLMSHNYHGGIALDNGLYSESRLDVMRVERPKEDIMNGLETDRSRCPSMEYPSGLLREYGAGNSKT